MLNFTGELFKYSNLQGKCMDLAEQNKFSEELGEFLARKLKGKDYHIIASVADLEKGFSFPISTLTNQSTYQALDLVTSGVVDESEMVIEQFKLPSSRKINKPVEPKW